MSSQALAIAARAHKESQKPRGLTRGLGPTMRAAMAPASRTIVVFDLGGVLIDWNPRHLYIGGGNAKHLKGELPANVTITANIAGLLGGIALWHDPKKS